MDVLMRLSYTLGVLIVLPVVIVTNIIGNVYGSAQLIWDAWR